jgi:Trypsin
MTRTIPAVVLVLLGATIAHINDARALVGADVADRTIARYTVLVAGKKGRCSGVVLTQNIVLTAAHCIVPGEVYRVGGNVSADDRVPPALLADVEEIVKHPLYRREDAGSPDLAMLRLAKPLPDRFIPAELSPRGIADGDALIAAGYGKTSMKEAAPKLALRMVLLRVTQTFRGWMILSSVGEDPSGGGPGDSGGPVFTYRGMHTLAGLIIGVSEKRTKVLALSAHYTWIRETQEKMQGKPSAR